MKLLTLKEVQFNKDDYVFKESTAKLLIVAIVAGIFSFIAIFFGPGIGMPSILIFSSSAGIGLFAIIHFCQVAIFISGNIIKPS